MPAMSATTTCVPIDTHNGEAARSLGSTIPLDKAWRKVGEWHRGNRLLESLTVQRVALVGAAVENRSPVPYAGYQS